MKKIIFLAGVLTASVMSIYAQNPIQTTATCGETVTITATPDAGYKFLYWADDHTNTNPIREVEVNDAMELSTNYEAVFDAASYTVVAMTSQTDMGSVAGGGEYAYGAEVILTATPINKCYRFKQWTDSNTDNPRTITVGNTTTANTYEAEFEETEFHITASSSGNGSVSISK